MSDEPVDEADVPSHAWEQDETVFTEDDDRATPELAVPDDQIAALGDDEGIDDLIDAARGVDDG
jgi:hypothetical protein